ncbi:glutamine synthetase family protein [Rhodococcus rhodochrous]|uniref:Glutamine synthetase n=1 Tax=Rhodococcus rhodochrous KG-21 TaxID=1441923 RepID=A0A0M9WQ93_RHORH|nr:glutamine synthetase family protein [Rhodococcus rhodochrous]KOS57537.1 glutamine synthetase [Rhodococcus rhodochrous KG-21]
MANHVSMTQLEVPDYDLGLRGKLVRSDKTVHPSGLAFCTIIYGLSLTDEVTDTPFSNAENGYPDLTLAPDESTRIDLPWRAGTQAVIGDHLSADGRPFEASPRAVLKSLVERYRALDLNPVLGYEYEVWVFRENNNCDRGDPTRFEPFGSTENAYSLTRSAEIDRFAQQFIDRMNDVGIEVEAFHAELGPGFFEFTLTPQPALKAADHAARARQYLRDLCAEHGLRASFMAKPFADKSGAGGHVHSSLARGGQNIFATEPGTLSPIGSRYLAGLVNSMPDLALMFNPFINSYKRIVPDMFVAEHASWGYDDRNVACRVLVDGITSARIEHRRPGADANPYVVADALLAGGLDGLQRSLELPQVGLHKGSAVDLPSNLSQALVLFESSPIAADLLGKTFTQSFAATRRAELNRFEQWIHSSITDWELSRHLEHQ